MPTERSSSAALTLPDATTGPNPIHRARPALPCADHSRPATHQPHVGATPSPGHTGCVTHLPIAGGPPCADQSLTDSHRTLVGATPDPGHRTRVPHRSLAGVALLNGSHSTGETQRTVAAVEQSSAGAGAAFDLSSLIESRPGIDARRRKEAAAPPLAPPSGGAPLDEARTERRLDQLNDYRRGEFDA
jgi:hypothetical protein